VQAPAFLERNALSVPLAADTELRAGDVVRTGRAGRVQLLLAEGSVVKLGANASFQIEALPVKRTGVFKAAFNVVAGAFRFTTNALAKAQRRDVTIRVRSATAGIRGTDLWGRSDETRDIICLIEGAIDVTPDGEATRRLASALDFYQRPVGQTSLPTAKVDEEQLAKWGLETELVPGMPAQSRDGKYQIVISATERDAALSIRKALRDAGYSTSLNDARITLTGYADPTVAQQQIELWTASAMLANAQAKVELMGKPKGKSNAKAKKVS
jgi:hypothetical protein